MDVVAIIQARMTSKRLPGKVLMDIRGEPALAHMIDRVRMAKRVQRLLVATTTNATDDAVVELCARLGVEMFRGDETDVLGRYLGAAEKARAPAIMRLTADCPMIDPDVLDQAVDTFASGAFDYVSNCNVRTFPDGLDVEVFTIDALREANTKAEHPFLREHVTPYIRGIRPQFGAGAFRIGHILAPADFSHVRWTLDTPTDLAVIRELIALLPHGYRWMAALAAATRQPHLLGVAPA